MARKFRFRLETVQKLRRHARDMQRRVVSEKVREVGAVERRIADAREDLGNAATRSRDLVDAEMMDMVQLRSEQLYRGCLHRTLDAAHEELAVRRRELSAEQAVLAEASKKLRVIEKLREKQWTRFRNTQAREEQAEQDEAGLQVFRRADSVPEVIRT